MPSIHQCLKQFYLKNKKPITNVNEDISSKILPTILVLRDRVPISQSQIPFYLSLFAGDKPVVVGDLTMSSSEG